MKLRMYILQCNRVMNKKYYRIAWRLLYNNIFYKFAKGLLSTAFLTCELSTCV